MIAYRVELWCQKCSEHFDRGTSHDDHRVLPGLGRNLESMALKAGWEKQGGAHICPTCRADDPELRERPKERGHRLR